MGTNQRLDFDATTNGQLIAIPGNDQIKILDTKTMQFKQVPTMTHHFTVNVCAFNHFDTSSHCILASGDVKGCICIWDIVFDGDKQFEVQKIDSIQCQEGEGVCNLIWRNANELYVSTTNANLFKYHFETKTVVVVNNENVNISNENVIADKVSTMDIDQTSNAQTEQKEEQQTIKKVEETKAATKVDSDDDDEDFDIDMGGDVDDNGKPSPTKKVLKRSFVESDDETLPKTVSVAQKPKAEVEPKPTTQPDAKQNDKIQAELAAAAEMFGDDIDPFAANQTVAEQKEPIPQSFSNQTKETKAENKPKLASFFDDEEDEQTMTKE